MPLVFTRKPGQSVLFFEAGLDRHICTVTYIRQPGKNRLSCSAGTDVAVKRGELTTDSNNLALYVCVNCGHNRITDDQGPTFDCPDCGASNSWYHQPGKP